MIALELDRRDLLSAARLLAGWPLTERDYDAIPWIVAGAREVAEVESSDR